GVWTRDNENFTVGLFTRTVATLCVANSILLGAAVYVLITCEISQRTLKHGKGTNPFSNSGTQR
ncbi:hypothetical protein BDZ89DRAFT_1084407, partial [Hymenopellis radicata]